MSPLSAPVANPEPDPAPLPLAAEAQPQLTVRAVATGALIGAVMCLSNLYVGLKTGLATGVALTACLVSFAAYRTLRRLRPRATPLSLLESNAMQSTASAAGYSTGGTIVTANAAYLLVTGHHTAPLVLLGWTFCLSALGVLFATSMKRQMIEVEQLPFPSGTAAAEMLRSLHRGDGDAAPRARALFAALFASGALSFLRDGLAALGSRLALPASFAWPGRILGAPLSELTFASETSLVAVSAGALIGLRTAVSMLLGALACYGIAAPLLHARGQLADLGFDGISSWSLWPGGAVIVSASLVELGFQGPALARAFRGLDTGGPGVDRSGRNWLLGVVAALTLATLVLARFAFGIPLVHGLIAVALSFALAAVAGRATGETDVTPSGSLGQITQLTYAVLMPRNPVANLMTASITGNTVAAAADTLTDLKAGHLLGAEPRKQIAAQLWGCAVGSLVIVPLFYLLVRGPESLGTERFPAPGATVLAKMAQLLAGGVGQLPPADLQGLWLGGLLGAGLAVLERVLPPRISRWMPSPMGFGLAAVLPASTAISMFLGAVASAGLRRLRPAAEPYVVPVASGLIAGESLVGAAVALGQTAGLLG